MAYIVRIPKGRYEYIYECRSRRIKGRRNPVSDRIYVGRVDMETRRFIPKSYVSKGCMDLETLEMKKGRELPRIPACYTPMRR